MYDDLVKRLRECTAEQNGEKTLWNQAADAIEELSRENKEIMFRANQLEAINDVLIKDDEEQAKEESEQIYKAYDSKAVKTGIKAFSEPPKEEWIFADLDTIIDCYSDPAEEGE